MSLGFLLVIPELLAPSMALVPRAAFGLRNPANAVWLAPE